MYSRVNALIVLLNNINNVLTCPVLAPGKAVVLGVPYKIIHLLNVQQKVDKLSTNLLDWNPRSTSIHSLQAQHLNKSTSMLLLLF